MIAIKPKACRVCKTKFKPFNSFETWCCPEHGAVIGLDKLEKDKAAKEAQDRRETRAKIREKKEQNRGWWMKKVEKTFNGWVRLRDAHRPCISCGRHHKGQWHAGHFKTVAAHPELRFEPLNVWKQCQPCNTHLHGNLLLYRASLVREIGIELVEWLEGPHELKHYTVDDLKVIDAHYLAKTKELKAGME